MRSTERFSGRSKTYSKHRPSYPPQLIAYLKLNVGWSGHERLADIGAGTGIFTDLLLEQGYNVVAVEPNDDMRQELLARLGQQHNADEQSNEPKSNEPEHNEPKHNERGRLTVVAGAAEATGLPAASVDGIVCAQSFHWFDAELARAEFARVLVPQGKVALLWNQRDLEASPFMKAYDALFMKYGEQYSQVKHKQMSVLTLAPFYGGKQPTLASFAYEQRLDLDGLLGRIFSSSFSLTEQDSRYDAFIRDIHELFARYEQAGEVMMIYRTDVYWGSLN